MLNHKQTAVVLAIGLVAVLMTSTSTRVLGASPFQNLAEPTLAQLPSHFFSEGNKVSNVLQGEENKIVADEHAIASKEVPFTQYENVPP